ncbi:MAG: L,D-transpeptidase family protein [Candidatus Hydrogenedentota bacterium]
MSTPSHEAPRGAERRRAQRVDTSRIAYYSRADGTTPLRQGTVVNMSASGMRIRASDSEENGTELTIELRPEGKGKDEEAVIFRGRVVSIRRGEGAEIELGIRLIPHRPGGVVSGGGRGAGRRYYRPERNGGDGPFARRIRPERPSARRKHRRYLLLIALLTLLVPLLLPGARRGERSENLTYDRSPDHRAFVRAPRVPSVDTGAVRAIRDDAPPSTHRIVEYSPPNMTRIGPFIQARSGYDASPRVGYASIANPALVLPAKSAHAKIVQLLARAERADAIGERGLALALARDAYNTASALSSVWEDTARATLDDLKHGRPLAKRLRDMAGLVTLGDAAASPSGEGTKIEVRIDRSRFTMTVFRGGVPLRAYAVGVGEDGATPAGRFRIANKLTDPDWYNRGNVVPAGDPANPIGHRWMGLGGEEAVTSVGIHPTAEPDSIGSGLSQGCIRMWPEDAESLFRLCTIGTPVTVE